MAGARYKEIRQKLVVFVVDMGWGCWYLSSGSDSFFLIKRLQCEQGEAVFSKKSILLKATILNPAGLYCVCM